MAEIQDLLVVDDNNVARWPENMHFAAVNNAGRADEGLLARWYQDMNSSIVASGSVNLFTITSNRTIAAYFNNLVIAFTANFSIVGACALNLNGLGSKTILRFNGDALAQGDIITGQPCMVIYKSSPDSWFLVSAPAALTGNTFADFTETAASNPAADTARMYALDESGTTNLAWRDSGGVVTGLRNATQAEMETGTSNVRTVTPGRQHFHPAHPKAWGRFDATGSLLSGSYKVASVVKSATGVYDVTMSTAMANTSYAVIATPAEFLTFSRVVGGIVYQTTTTFQIVLLRPDLPAQTDSGASFMVFGDLP